MTHTHHGGYRPAGESAQDSMPLHDKRILLTRAEEDCREWARELTLRGAQAVILPCITTELIDSRELRGAVRRAAEHSDWLVFTSRRGVHAFAELAGNARVPGETQIAAVGPATASAAQAMFGRVDVIGGEGTEADGESDGEGKRAADLLGCKPGAADVHRTKDGTANIHGPSAADVHAPKPGTAEALAATLERALASEVRPKVTLALAENARSLLERALTAAGARCTRLNVYRTVPAPPRQSKEALSALDADNVLLASPSAVTGLVNQVEMDVPAALFAIGPSTAARIRELGLAVAGEAREPSLDGLLEILQCRN